MYRNQIATVLQQFQSPSPKTCPAYGSRFEHRHAFQQRVIEEQRQQLQKQQELICKLQENQKLSRDKEEGAQAMAVTQIFKSSVSQSMKKKESRCKNTTPLRYIPSIKQGQLVIMSQSHSSWARICQARFSHASAVCCSSQLWLSLKESIRLATVLCPSPSLHWLNIRWSTQDLLRNSNTSVTHSSRDLFSYE